MWQRLPWRYDQPASVMEMLEGASTVGSTRYRARQLQSASGEGMEGFAVVGAIVVARVHARRPPASLH
jgi:hypothetical protein